MLNLATRISPLGRPNFILPPITLLGSTKRSGTGTTSSLSTLTASLLIAAVSGYGGVATPTDSKSNSWTALTLRQYSANTATKLFYCASPTTDAAHTFSVSGGTFPSIIVAAFTATLASSPFDVENGAANTSGTSLATGSITPSLAGELIVASFGWFPAQTISVDSGMTMIDQVNYAPGVGIGIALAWLAQGAAAAINPTFTAGGALNERVAAIASFKRS